MTDRLPPDSSKNVGQMTPVEAFNHSAGVCDLVTDSTLVPVEAYAIMFISLGRMAARGRNPELSRDEIFKLVFVDGLESMREFWSWGFESELAAMGDPSAHYPSTEFRAG
jgi:hypothetical protein